MNESQQAPQFMQEALARLIHIEEKINGIMEQGVLVRDAPAVGHRDQAFGCITYAQHGEDLIFLNIFHQLGKFRPSYMDIGAFHPFNISNTALLYARGSRGINVEANPNLIGDFQAHRPDDINLNIGVGPRRGKMSFYRIDDWSGRNSFSKDAVEEFVREHPTFKIQDVIEIEVRTINDVVDDHLGGHWPDLLCIDAEGLDYDILESANFKERGPDVICVEAISGADKDQSSDLVNLLKGRSYIPLFKTNGNVIFIHDDLKSKLLP